VAAGEIPGTRPAAPNDAGRAVASLLRISADNPPIAA
jgi:hypothetical protein